MKTKDLHEKISESKIPISPHKKKGRILNLIQI